MTKPQLTEPLKEEKFPWPIKRIEFVPPVHLNFYLHDDYFLQKLQGILDSDKKNEDKN